MSTSVAKPGSPTQILGPILKIFWKSVATVSASIPRRLSLIYNEWMCCMCDRKLECHFGIDPAIQTSCTSMKIDTHKPSNSNAIFSSHCDYCSAIVLHDLAQQIEFGIDWTVLLTHAVVWGFSYVYSCRNLWNPKFSLLINAIDER